MEQQRRAALLDTLGRQFLTKQKLDDTTELETKTTFDITGKPLTVTDSRQIELNKDTTLRPTDADKVNNFVYTYDMLGATLRTINIDAGDDRTLTNIMGNPVASFDSRGHKITASYDAVHRLTNKTVEGGNFSAPHIVEFLEYGEGFTNDTQNNLRGRLRKHWDSSGMFRIIRYSIKGEPTETRKRIRTEYKEEANWDGDNNELLESEKHDTVIEYDALGRVNLQTNPDDSIVNPNYHQSGRLNTVWVKPKGATEGSFYVTGITYNAKSQRKKIVYGNNTESTYEYEPTTFRLTKLETKKTGTATLLQDISYVYDPVGNIVKITDDSHSNTFGVENLPDPVLRCRPTDTRCVTIDVIASPLS